jgi:hypothetical protein
MAPQPVGTAIPGVSALESVAAVNGRLCEGRGGGKNVAVGGGISRASTCTRPRFFSPAWFPTLAVHHNGHSRFLPYTLGAKGDVLTQYIASTLLVLGR